MKEIVSNLGLAFDRGIFVKMRLLLEILILLTREKKTLKKSDRYLVAFSLLICHIYQSFTTILIDALPPHSSIHSQHQTPQQKKERI